uniref:Ion transport domain-containing protein n=1 Tax=Noctiluca scintillans TaxID=2966 RepID=A0A7S1F7E8_NOCSC|mmetsp:Transcript_4052/g.11374  ORF Transcript_4052/g.11374 Transcript_4052/m.11374 type:complete len:242 (+) Transcript_4052:15-740(+)
MLFSSSGTMLSCPFQSIPEASCAVADTGSTAQVLINADCVALELECSRDSFWNRLWKGRRTQGVTKADRARLAITSWRLRRPYLIYCLVCSAATSFLLGWNFAKGMENNWNLPQWKHHRWEEILEVSIGLAMTLETSLTICLLKGRFFRNCWNVFDFVVMLLTIISIGYGLKHIGRQGEVCEADVPLLVLRFALQPVRVLTAFVCACKTRQMQQGVDELTVNFDALPPFRPHGFGYLEQNF